MQINANLPAGIDRFALRAAGLDVEGVLELEHDVDAGRATLPKTLRSIYIADPAVRVAVTVLGFGEGDNIDRWRDKSGRIAFERVRRGETPTRIRIEIDDAEAGKAIGENLAFYSFENDGELVWWKEHSETWHRIDTVLRREGLSHDKLGRGEGPIPRRAIEGLIELAGKLDPQRRNNVHSVLSGRNVAKKDRPLVAACLIEEFEREPMLDDQLSTRIYEVAGPGNADDLIRLIKDSRYGDDRWPLCLALARTKHPDAADTIASILGQGVNTRGALEALAKLPAQAHVEKIRKYLRDPSSDVRRQAKKTLQKLGVAFEAPPPLHLVKNKRSYPKSLQEWSSNLDMDNLVPTLKKLARCIDMGFGEPEIAEVAAVAEETPAEQTRTFRFPVRSRDRTGDLWIELFMDDTDAPDVAIHAHPDVMRRVAELLE